MSHHLLQYFKHAHLDADHQSVVKQVNFLANRVEAVLKESPEKTDALAALLKATTFLAVTPLSGPLPETVADGGYKPEYVDELKKLIAEKSAENAAHVDYFKSLEKELAAKEQQINDMLNYQSVNKDFKLKENEDLTNGK